MGRAQSPAKTSTMKGITVIREYEPDLQRCAKALLLILAWHPGSNTEQKTDGASSEEDETRARPEGVTPQG